MHSPSPFYDLFQDAKRYTLSFPTTDLSGPYWDDDGEIIRCFDSELEVEDIEAVRIQGGHYRLAERCSGPFSILRLHWGDEFLATIDCDGRLNLLRVVMPQPFVHHRFVTSSPFNNDHPTAALLHKLGGGWEAVAGGVLTLTVPAACATEFARWILVSVDQLSLRLLND